MGVKAPQDPPADLRDFNSGPAQPSPPPPAVTRDEVIHVHCPQPRHPGVAHLLFFFSYGHLPPHLQAVSKPFCELAEKIADGPSNAETVTALRKLLESKDCAVRAVLSGHLHNDGR